MVIMQLWTFTMILGDILDMLISTAMFYFCISSIVFEYEYMSKKIIQFM